eukprot:5585383-Amphidinium_carterae.1
MDQHGVPFRSRLGRKTPSRCKIEEYHSNPSECPSLSVTSFSFRRLLFMAVLSSSQFFMYIL